MFQLTKLNFNSYLFQIELFSLQVLHKAPVITACGMFTIDNTLIYGVSFIYYVILFLKIIIKHF